MDNTDNTSSRHAARERARKTQRQSSAVCALLASVMLLVTGNAAFAQGDSSNLLPGWSCDSDGDSTVEEDDFVRIEISGGGTAIGDETRRVEEGDDIVIRVIRTLPVSLQDCDVDPATPWVMALRLTRVATTGASQRVPDSLLYERRVEIHRDQETFTLRVPTLGNKNTGKDTKIDIALVATGETDSRIILQGTHRRVEIWDADPHNYYFDIACDEDGITITEGPGAVVEIPVKIDCPPEYDTSVLVVRLAGTAVPGSDYLNTGVSTRMVFEDGSNSETAQVQLANNDVLEDTEAFSVRLFRSGLVDHASTHACIGEDGPESPEGAATLKVTILDDDTVGIILGPKERDAQAGDPIPITGTLDTESTSCVVPFSFYLNATASGAVENVLSEHTASNLWSHCISRTQLFNLETRVAPHRGAHALHRAPSTG